MRCGMTRPSTLALLPATVTAAPRTRRSSRCSWHKRVLGLAGRLLLRANFSDHHPRPWWLEHFPRGLEVDASLFQPLHEVIATFTSAGWRVASFGTVTEPSSGTRGDMLERLRLRTLSFFAHLSPDELEAGFRRLEQAVAADPGAPAPMLSEPLLTLERSAA